jgi:hypothetical protein
VRRLGKGMDVEQSQSFVGLHINSQSYQRLKNKKILNMPALVNCVLRPKKSDCKISNEMSISRAGASL